MARQKNQQQSALSESTNELAAKLRNVLTGRHLSDPLGRDLTDDTDDGYDPVVFLWLMAHNDSVADPELRKACASEVAKYVAPQLKSSEVTGAGGGPLQIEVTDRYKE